jgi:hypothetical protein
VLHESFQTDPGLALIHAAWERLPEAVRADLMATVEATLR